MPNAPLWRLKIPIAGLRAGWRRVGGVQGRRQAEDRFGWSQPWMFASSDLEWAEQSKTDHWLLPERPHGSIRTRSWLAVAARGARSLALFLASLPRLAHVSPANDPSLNACACDWSLQGIIPNSFADETTTVKHLVAFNASAFAR